MTDILKYPRGSVIQFTTGKYSDFGTCALIVTIVDCDLPELARQFWRAEKMRVAAALKADPATYPDTPDSADFPAWLIANGHAMPVDGAEVHLGSHREFDGNFGVSP